MAATLRTIRVTIAKVNDTGFQTAEQPGVWLNFSKYKTPAPVIPPVGTRIEAAVDPRGFVMAIEPVHENGASVETAAPRTSSPSSDQAALRLAVLEIAARFLSTRPDAKATDVITVATSWEGWVRR